MREQVGKRRSPFWKFQVGGWLIFFGATFPTKLLVCGSVPEVIGSFILRDGVSFLLTLVMRAIYRHVYQHHKDPMWVGGSILIVSSAAALVQLPFYYWFGDIFPYEEKTIFGQFAAAGILTFRGGQFLGWSILYFGIKIWLEKQAAQKRFQEEREIRQQTELQMLRVLINSHFLCNSLSSIMETWRLGKAVVGEMLQALSDYLHYSLKHRSDDVVPLSEEIEALENYLVLQKARLGLGLDFEMQITEEARGAKVPGFVLQPLVENAIKYGQESHPRRVTVRVVISREGSRLIIQVFNTGHWIKPDPFRESGGVGLEVIQRKFAWLYPGQSSLTTLDEQGWVTVEIKIPYIP